MSSLPSNITRVPNLLASQLFLARLTRTNVDLLGLQEQLATGRAVNRPSDDAVRASAIATLDDRLERADQRLGNLQFAAGALGQLDTAVGDASSLVLEASSIASSQIGVNSDPTTRSNQAIVIDSMIRQLFDLANRSTNGVYLFGGSTPSAPPVRQLNGGYQYTAQGSGLVTDLDIGEQIPVTLGGDNTIGQVSARLRSTADLNPGLTGSTRLADLHGARGLGVAPGVVHFSFNGGPDATVDLTNADTAQNVADALTSAVRQYETANSVTILGPGGVSFANGGLSIDVVTGAPSNPQLTFSDAGSGATAQDLGLTQSAFSATSAAGADLNPRLTLLTPLSAIPGLTLPPGSIRLRFTRGTTSGSQDVDLSSARTIDDVRRLIQSNAQGVRVQVNSAGTGIDIFNEVSGPALSIEEVPGNNGTATQLGIRSMDANTLISDFNDGRGVRIVNGSLDPITGQPNPALDVDFRITLGNGPPASSFPVDLRPQDMTNVQSVIARINAEAATAVTNGLIPAGSFSAGLTNGANGIALTQTLGPNPGPITVTRQNNSAAAEDLGLTNGVYDAASATFVAQDRAAVRVNNLFTTLMDLRDALRQNDDAGITLAGEQLNQHTDRIAGTRALVGVYDNRVQGATHRQEDLKVLDQQTKSQMQDLDFADASIRFNLLRTQLQAGLTSGSRAQSLTLLDFLT